MKNQKIAIATVVGTILIFLLDYLYYAVLMGSPGMGECCMKESPDMIWMIIADVLLALGFVVLYTKAAGSGSKMSEGINFGIWVAVLLAISMNVMWFSLSTSITMNQVFMESAYGIVKYCILGIAVAYLVADSSSGSRGKASGGGETDSTQSPTGGTRGKATGSGE
jgi:hypothetical protein